VGCLAAITTAWPGQAGWLLSPPGLGRLAGTLAAAGEV